MDGGEADDTVRLRQVDAARHGGMHPPAQPAAGPSPRRRAAGALAIGGSLLLVAGVALVWAWRAEPVLPEAPSAPARATAPRTDDGTPTSTATDQAQGDRGSAANPPAVTAGQRRDPPQRVALTPVAPDPTEESRGIALLPSPAVPTLPDAAPPATLPPPDAAPPARLPPPDAAPPARLPPPDAAPRLADPPLLASEAELVAMVPERPVMLRLRDNPAVFILLFPTLDEQGAALNRIAALVEKAGLPRDRLLNDADLAVAIQRSGESPATWYLGHDYQGVDLARFFALAERDGIVLTSAETWVRDRFREARALVPETGEIALISTANTDHRFDAAMRAAILRHEIAHGHFFTRPEVRAHVLKVWRDRFRDRDRQAMRNFLGREGYDTSNELLMANEAMAYLLFTPDPRFFSARLAGVTEAELARMRAMMRDGLPIP